MVLLMEFVDEMTALFYEILKENRTRILEFLRNPRIIGRNPQGETTRFFDKAIEKLLIEKLREKGFEGTIIGEELGKFEGKGKGWIYIDPLDGSLNAARGVDFYCLSLAYADRPKIEDIRVGFVWDIPRDVIYFAEKNQGAFRLEKEKVVRLLTPPETDDIVLDVGFTINEECLREIRNKGTLRRMGSIVLSSIYVAEGRFDGVFDMGNLKVTDVAAAYIIVREARGYVFVDVSEIKENRRVKLIMARNKEIFDWLIELYNRYIRR